MFYHRIQYYNCLCQQISSTNLQYTITCNELYQSSQFNDKMLTYALIHLFPTRVERKDDQREYLLQEVCGGASATTSSGLHKERLQLVVQDNLIFIVLYYMIIFPLRESKRNDNVFMITLYLKHVVW
jgi:hypothetical protein